MAMFSRCSDTNEPSEIQNPPKSSIVKVGACNVLTMCLQFLQCTHNFDYYVLAILFLLDQTKGKGTTHENEKKEEKLQKRPIQAIAVTRVI